MTGLAEVVIWTRDLDASLGFYRDLLGLEVISPPELRNRFLRAGTAGGGVPAMVVLVPHPDPDLEFPREKPRRVLHHIALSIEPGRLEALERECRARAMEVRGGVHPVLPDVRTVYIDDPDGNEVELIAPA